MQTFENMCPAVLVKQSSYGKGAIHVSRGGYLITSCGHLQPKAMGSSSSSSADFAVPHRLFLLSHKDIEERVSADLHGQASRKELS